MIILIPDALPVYLSQDETVVTSDEPGEAVVSHVGCFSYVIK